MSVPDDEIIDIYNRIRSLEAEVARLRQICCRGDDPNCPCHDGDPCHYRGDKPMKTALEWEVAFLREALKQYGYHMAFCQAGYGNEPCTCGFDEAVKELGK